MVIIMKTIQLNGKPVHTHGRFPQPGEIAPMFTLTRNNLSELFSHELQGRRLVLNIFPSLDTDICAASVRKFNELAASLDNTTVISISNDLPFAQKRFCTTEGIENLIAASAFRSPEFAKEYGVEMIDGPLAKLLARAVVIIDEQGKIVYSELVPEIAQEPNYQAAIEVLKPVKEKAI